MESHGDVTYVVLGCPSSGPSFVPHVGSLPSVSASRRFAYGRAYERRELMTGAHSPPRCVLFAPTLRPPFFCSLLGHSFSSFLCAVWFLVCCLCCLFGCLVVVVCVLVAVCIHTFCCASVVLLAPMYMFRGTHMHMHVWLFLFFFVLRGVLLPASLPRNILGPQTIFLLVLGRWFVLVHARRLLACLFPFSQTQLPST